MSQVQEGEEEATYDPEEEIRAREARRAIEIELAWRQHEREYNKPFAWINRGVSDDALERLSEAQNHRCCYCGVRFSDAPRSPATRSREHVVPVSLGGEDSERNVVAACVSCNGRRGTRMDPEHLEAAAVAGLPVPEAGGREVKKTEAGGAGAC